ncbi:MAG: ABC transporter ATP-binding protein [bacterium]|nr:ABC transporter ATP-binding protein [bacterium]
MKSLLTINHYFIRYKWQLISGILFVILSNIFNVAVPYLVRQVFDEVQLKTTFLPNFANNQAQLAYSNSVLNTALWFGALILLASIIRGVFMFFMRQTLIVMSRKIEYDMKHDIFNHYQKLSQRFYRKNYTGDLMNRLSEDVGRVRMYIGPAIMYIVNLVFTFITVIYMMFSVNVEMSLYVLMPLPILSIAIYYISEIINKKSDKIQEKLSDITSLSQETFSGIRVLKSFAVEQSFLRNMETESENYRVKKMSLTLIDSLFNPMMLVLVSLSTLLTIYLGGKGVINGTFSYGNIAEFVIYVNLLTWPVASLGWVTSLVQRAAASQTRINQFLDEKPEITNQTNTPFHFSKTIEWKTVDFRYDEKTFDALSQINFTLKKGHTLGIIGATGSGKSTMAALLLRLIEPTNGKILIDDQPLDAINLDNYRQQIGYVPQDVFLFSDTIANNIAFGSKDKDNRELIIKYAKQAHVHENIIHFKDGYETVIGERGITLSGGQKQRVAIARALIREPEILILDDCLSAVDQETEKQILSELKQVMQDKTAVIISHRLSSVVACDEIIVLEDGRIIERGNHQTLIELNGLYAEIYNKQQH